MISNVTPALAAEMGLSADEFARCEAILGRTLPRYRVTMADLYRHQVIADLAAALRTRAGAELFPQRIPE